MNTFFIIFLLLTTAAHADSVNNPLCIDEQILSEPEKTPAYNLLSFPAESTGDKYVIAISYFNNKMNIIVRDNYVTQYEYSGVPFKVYKSFLYSVDKKEFYRKCIKDHYEVLKVY